MSKELKIPNTKREFVINCEHADMIVNDLLQGEYETLGRIFVDLVNFNLYGDLSITETECQDKADRTARRLLKADSERYIENWLSRSQKNSKNRKSGQQPDNAEVKDYARAKGYDENVAVGWALEQAKRDWTDTDGEPIKYWKQKLDAYMKAVNRNRIEEMTKTIGRR